MLAFADALSLSLSSHVHTPVLCSIVLGLLLADDAQPSERDDRQDDTDDDAPGAQDPGDAVRRQQDVGRLGRVGHTAGSDRVGLESALGDDGRDGRDDGEGDARGEPGRVERIAVVGQAGMVERWHGARERKRGKEREAG